MPGLDVSISGRPSDDFFQMGVPTGADTSEADGYPDFTAEKRDDIYFISVGSERYEIFDAIVLGG